MNWNLYQQVDILFSILEELLSSPFNKQFDDKAKHVLSKHGLEVVEGKIIKTQRRMSAKAKENGYGESEDEKIRTALIHFFSNSENTSFEYWEGIPKKEVLTWLEQQKSK